jgi:NAD-dependent deacetylase
MKKVVVFTGAGVSAESGLKTFRDSDGMWEEYNVMEVATPEAWQKNPQLVTEFYNKRRQQIIQAKPNEAHQAIVELESYFDVQIITQNVDDLHERAGSKKVLHLHGEINKAQSSIDENLIYPLNGKDIQIGQLCEKGSQLRPHVVWFGEAVPNMETSYQLVKTADIFIVVGTSLTVHPAASLVYYTKKTCNKYLVDPNPIKVRSIEKIQIIQEKASVGVPQLVEMLTKSFR